MKALNVENFKQANSGNTIVLDTRMTEEFVQGFIPGSISIELNEKFAERCLNFLPAKTPLILVVEPGKEDHAEQLLTNTGHSDILGFLEGGFDSWKYAGEPADMIIDVEADELMMDIPFDKNLVVLDVRNKTEFAEGHLKNAINIPAQELTDPGSMANFEDEHNIYLHCGGGSRSITAASLLKRQGYHNLRCISGGWNKIKAQKKAEIVKETKTLN